MNKTMAARVLVGFSILLVNVSPPAQVTAQNNRTVVGRVVKPTGWTIPGLSGSQVLDARHPLPSGYGVKDVPIEIIVMKPGRQSEETVLLYGSQDGGKTIIVGERRAAIRSIIKCDLDNKVFLYIVQFGALVYDSASNRTDQSGIFGLMYYDDDGDGIFETRESGVAVSPETRIPGWVLKNPPSP